MSSRLGSKTKFLSPSSANEKIIPGFEISDNDLHHLVLTLGVPHELQAEAREIDLEAQEHPERTEALKAKLEPELKRCLTLGNRELTTVSAEALLALNVTHREIAKPLLEIVESNDMNSAAFLNAAISLGDLILFHKFYAGDIVPPLVYRAGSTESDQIQVSRSLFALAIIKETVRTEGSFGDSLKNLEVLNPLHYSCLDPKSAQRCAHELEVDICNAIGIKAQF